jgi:hypothetical protein
MPILDIYLDDILIGHVSLEHLDTGMGVAYGSFHPGPHYSAIRPRITAAAESRNQGVCGENLDLQARSRSGEVVSAGFIQIDDFADVEVDPEATVQFSDREQWERISKLEV